jgi:hypothetical protein
MIFCPFYRLTMELKGGGRIYKFWWGTFIPQWHRIDWLNRAINISRIFHYSPPLLSSSHYLLPFRPPGRGPGTEKAWLKMTSLLPVDGLSMDEWLASGQLANVYGEKLGPTSMRASGMSYGGKRDGAFPPLLMYTKLAIVNAEGAEEVTSA